MNIKDIIKEENAKFLTSIQTSKQERFVKIELADFEELFLVFAKQELVKRGKFQDYSITREIENLLKQMYCYLTGNEKEFKGDLYKSIAIIGDYGTGKTIFATAFYKVYMALKELDPKIYHAKTFVENLKINLINKADDIEETSLIENYKNKPILLDDVGKEAPEIKVFGSVLRPFIDLIATRYERNKFMVFTSNFKVDNGLLNIYDNATNERLFEMFNFFELNETNFRRKKSK